MSTTSKTNAKPNTKPKTKAKKIALTPINDRMKAGENQSTYWGRVGVTRSSGSRYEDGRAIGRPVRMLLALVAGKATVEQLKSGELAQLV